MLPAPTGFTGTGTAFGGFNAALAGTPTNPLNEAGGFQVTSTVLPPAQFPLFRSAKGGDYAGVPGPFEPIEGQWYVAGTHQDNLYRRLTRTIDLSGVTAAQAPAAPGADQLEHGGSATTTSSSRPARRAARTGRRCRT